MKEFSIFKFDDDGEGLVPCAEEFGLQSRYPSRKKAEKALRPFLDTGQIFTILPVYT